ncbi:MAG: lipoyl(octanoyl) transferase LipB [Hyphomicrobiales bacterium]|nr:lipoyl(octanoyl) transferase LipB [Hyphomicrobiales bacterium]
MIPEKKSSFEIASSDVEWRISDRPVPYPDAVAEMERIAADISLGNAPETVWLLEHPPIYTAGTSAQANDLIRPDRFPVYKTGRGGQYTYHGPGQRVVYLMLDLTRRGRDVRRFVCQIESWIIDALGQLDVKGHTRKGRTGIWVARPDKGPQVEDKIAAIGIRVRRWVTFHGVSLNVCPNLTHYAGIVACGITDQGVTSLADMEKKYSLNDADRALIASFPKHFDLKSVGEESLTI